jgi:maltose O-acetyltransferase
MSNLSISKLIHIIKNNRRKKHLASLVKNGLKLGRNVDIIGDFFFDPSHCLLISIGDNCTICPNVRLIAHDASTKKFLGYTKIGKIDIRDNCFIGDSAIVLPDVTIGPNSIVGAGAVITNDVPPKTVFAGNPARQIYSFETYIKKIERLMINEKLFDQKYLIDKLNDERREEMLESIKRGLGFIV